MLLLLDLLIQPRTPTVSKRSKWRAASYVKIAVKLEGQSGVKIQAQGQWHLSTGCRIPFFWPDAYKNSLRTMIMCNKDPPVPPFDLCYLVCEKKHASSNAQLTDHQSCSLESPCRQQLPVELRDAKTLFSRLKPALTSVMLFKSLTGLQIPHSFLTRVFLFSFFYFGFGNLGI